MRATPNSMLFVNLQEQESVQVSEQRCAQLEKARRELERQLSGLSDRLEEEEACSAQLALHRERLEVECSNLRRDLDELESALAAAEQDKQVEHYVTFITGYSPRTENGFYSDRWLLVWWHKCYIINYIKDRKSKLHKA